jgi:GNAT superfamily N-acetyltransferase
MKPEYKLVAKAKYVQKLSALGGGIFRECYARRFAPKQLEALIDAQLSPEAIEAQMDAGMNYFLVLLAEEPVGFFAWQMQGGVLYLAHLYLQPGARGHGIGRDIVQSCERLARADGKTALTGARRAKAARDAGLFQGRRLPAPAPRDPDPRARPAVGVLPAGKAPVTVPACLFRCRVLY